MPTHTPAISIIVPIYNVERYLCECIDSIIAQTFVDWELLLIDDGSTDNSRLICEDYASKDKRIRVTHKPNGGVSSARNLGLDHAQGEYLTFVDADDWIDKDNLEICVSAMEQNRLDVLQFPFKRIGADGKVMLIQDIVPTDVDELPHYITRGRFNLCVWGGVYAECHRTREPHQV